jgi:hypothetical protein
MRDGILYQPYAIYYSNNRLRLWVLLHKNHRKAGLKLKRYEIAIDKNGGWEIIDRPVPLKLVSGHLPPLNLSRLKQIPFPRNPRERIQDAICDVLTGEQAGTIIRFTRFGIEPDEITPSELLKVYFPTFDYPQPCEQRSYAP